MRTRLAPRATLAAGGLALALGVPAVATQPAGASGEPFETLEIMAPYFSTVAPESDDPVGTALSELAGATLDITWVPNADYGERTNVTLAGDDIPHIMVIQGKDQSFISTAEVGGFWDLTEYVESGEYPNLVAANPEVQVAASVNGRVYGIFRARDVIRASVIIRADWLENLGLEKPETTDDLMELARAFTEDDPDGNGEDDTYGLIVPQWPGGFGTNSPYDTIDVWFGAGNVWRDDDGELVPAFTTDEWKQSIDFQRELIQNGYINPDYATMDPATWNEPFLNGEGGIIIDVHSRVPQLVNLFRESGEEDATSLVTVAGQLDGPNGTYALPTPGYAGFLAIPKVKVQTEEELHQVLSVLDALNTTEAQILMNNGIEGDNFTVEDGFMVENPDRADFTDQVTGAWAQLGMNVGGNEFYLAAPQTEEDAALRELRLQLEAEDLENAVFNPAMSLISPTYTRTAAQLDLIISDARIQYLAGQIDEAGLDAAIERWLSTGGEQVTAEINELYDELPAEGSTAAETTVSDG